MKRILMVSLALLLVLPLSIGLAACGNGEGDTMEPEDLGPVAITEYEGTNLSAIDDFRENSIKGPQHVDAADYRLEITGLVKQPANYTYDEVIDDHKSYKKVVTLDCVEGWSVTILWEGIKVEDLLQKSGVLPEANTVIFHAYDGYTSSLPLDFITDKDILMAYRMNDVTLPPERGFPFQLVAESKWGYKWVKWITKIELSDDPEYRGYWEQAGFSNDGDVNKGIYEWDNS